MSIDDLPAPMPGAKEVAMLGAAIASDVLALFLPGANTVQLAIMTLIERRMRAAERTLLEALKAGDVAVLTQEQYEFAIPSAFRFYEAARDGEAAHNLRILAEILVGRIKTARLESADFSRICRQLEGLSTSDLAALVAVVEIDALHQSRQPESGDFREKHYTERLIPSFFDSVTAMGSSLAVLAGRGIVVPDHQSTWDAVMQAYLPGPNAAEIIERARETLVDKPSTSEKAANG